MDFIISFIQPVDKAIREAVKISFSCHNHDHISFSYGIEDVQFFCFSWGRPLRVMGFFVVIPEIIVGKNPV